MADAPKKISRRLTATEPPPKQISRTNIVPASSAKKPGSSSRIKLPSGRQPKIPLPARREPAHGGGPEPVSDEPLFSDGDAKAMSRNPPPLEIDPKAHSEDMLYSDEDVDPREKALEIRKSNRAKAVPVSGRAPAAPAPAPKATDSKRQAPSPVAPVKARAAELDADDADDESDDDEEEEVEEAEVVQAPPARPSPSTSGRTRIPSKTSGRNPKASGRSAKIDDSGERSGREDGEGRDDARRSVRKSVRSAPAAIAIKKSHMIMACAGVFLILVAVLGYSPLMRSMNTKTLEDPTASVENKKSAASALFNGWESASFEIFRRNLASAEPATREAAAHGMGLIARGKTNSERAIDEFGNGMALADAAGKVVYLKELDGVAQALPKPKDGEPASDNAKAIAAIAIPLSAVKEDNAVRVAAVEALGTLPVAGVCKQLLAIALIDKGDLRDKALKGIYATALPDAAGELIKAAAEPDKEVAQEAKRAFVHIRDEAKSAELVPLVTHNSDSVRKEIVAALAKRNADTKAAEGITRALQDKLPEIRIMAVTAVPVTGISGSPDQLSALVKDPEESVRIATAGALAQLRDADSFNVILKAFKEDLQGKSLDAFIAALGKRSSGKDMKNIGMVMGLLDTNPAAENSIREALVLLTRAGGTNRDAQRRRWDTATWKKWYANINEREQLHDSAREKLNGAAKRKDEGMAVFKECYKITKEGLEALEKCKAMCLPDDPEDEEVFEREMLKASRQQDFFLKGSGVF